MSDKKLGVLTGAAGHIGRAAVEKFASNGWSLVITDMSDAVFSVAPGRGQETRYRSRRRASERR